MRGPSIMVDYKRGPDLRHRGENPIHVKNFKSNHAWSCEIDVNNAYADLNELDKPPPPLFLGGFSNYLL